MIPTAVRLARGPGVMKRTQSELGRLTKMVWHMEHMETPVKPHYLLDFEQEWTVDTCKTMADRAVGGYSTANLDYVPADPATNSPAHARFHGSISTKLPTTNWRVERTGYAAFRNKDRTWLFGQLFWDMDMHSYLALRVKSDGRRYTVNVQTDSIVETDIHQHRLFTSHHRIPQSAVDSESASSSDAPPALADFTPSSNSSDPSSSSSSSSSSPPPSSSSSPASSDDSTTLSHTTTPDPDATGWETIFIKWDDFVRTNLGFVVEPQTGLMRNKIKSVGIGLTDRVEGPYDLRIHRMWATNGLSPEEMEEEKRICGPRAVHDGATTAPGEFDGPSVVERESEGLDRLKDLKGLRKKGGG